MLLVPSADRSEDEALFARSCAVLGLLRVPSNRRPNPSGHFLGADRCCARDGFFFSRRLWGRLILIIMFSSRCWRLPPSNLGAFHKTTRCAASFPLGTFLRPICSEFANRQFPFLPRQGIPFGTSADSYLLRPHHGAGSSMLFYLWYFAPLSACRVQAISTFSSSPGLASGLGLRFFLENLSPTTVFFAFPILGVFKNL